MNLLTMPLRNSRVSPPKLTLLAYMQEQDAPDFFDSMGIRLGGVPGAHHQFRIHIIKVSTLVSDDPIPAFFLRAIALHGYNGMSCNI